MSNLQSIDLFSQPPYKGKPVEHLHENAQKEILEGRMHERMKAIFSIVEDYDKANNKPLPVEELQKRLKTLYSLNLTRRTIRSSVEGILFHLGKCIVGTKQGYRLPKTLSEVKEHTAPIRAAGRSLYDKADKIESNFVNTIKL